MILQDFNGGDLERGGFGFTGKFYQGGNKMGEICGVKAVVHDQSGKETYALKTEGGAKTLLDGDLEVQGEICQHKKEKYGMVYKVYVINLLGEIIMDKTLTAIDEDEARLEAGIESVMKENKLKYGDVTINIIPLAWYKMEKEPILIKNV